jgi:hypothetical protein
MSGIRIRVWKPGERKRSMAQNLLDVGLVLILLYAVIGHIR